MTEDIINNLTDKGTKQSNTKPLLKARHKFILIILLDFDFKIIFSDNVSLNDFISLFTMYYTPEIINIIV
jgi:hypothetical protein